MKKKKGTYTTMPKREILKVKESYAEPTEEWDGWILRYTDESIYEGDESQPATDTPLEELADFCDQNAESRNNHDYVRAHRILAALLHRELGRAQATHLLREIAAYGGLDGMVGDGGQADAFADFGLEENEEDWKLEDKDEEEKREAHTNG